MHKLLLSSLLIFTAAPLHAILWSYGEFNDTYKTCTLTGWSGSQPTSGKLSVPASYTGSNGTTYTVYAIGRHALDNLTEVTQITIPASVVEIAYITSATQTSGDIMNFGNCPKLKKFVVEEGNTSFQSTGAGLLYTKGLQTLYKVPQALEVSSGSLNLSSNTRYIAEDAFSENTTITSLTIPRNAVVRGNGGLNHAVNMAGYSLSGTATVQLKLSGCVLTDVSGNVISYPPAATTASVKLPSEIKTIVDYAFANAAGLRSVSIASVSTIGKYAFSNSGIESVTLPVYVSTTGMGCFQNCRALTSIKYEASKLTIPDYFACGCTSLAAVSGDNPPVSIGKAAFKNCRQLQEFPFSASTTVKADSIFYGCGFSKVVYDELTAGDSYTGAYFLTGNPDLELIDASAIDTESEYFTIGADYAAQCRNLVTVQLPAYTAFWRLTDSATDPAFGYSCVIDRIECHSFSNISKRPQFGYSTTSTASHFEPHMYIAVTGNMVKHPGYANGWPVANLFTAGNGATVAPQIFVDSYKPAEDYVDPLCSYFIPGGCSSNYGEAVRGGCEVTEMYGIGFDTKSSSGLRVTVDRAVKPAGVTSLEFVSIDFGGGDVVDMRTANYAVSQTAADEVKSVLVNYRIDGVSMSTSYPATHWLTTSIADITVEPGHSDCSAEYYTTDGLPLETPRKGINIVRNTATGEITKIII